MVQKIPPEEINLTIKFGGGLHSKASPDEINDREASDGYNFLIDLENRNLRNRPPFDLIGTVPNAAEIRGGFSLLKADGTVKTAFQAAGNVYEWNGESTFTLIGTCNSASNLRGHWRSHNWTLADKVIVTDLNLSDVVKEWDGTTFQSTTFTNEAGSGFGSFYAKYVNVSNERAIFSNIKDGSGSYPHIIVGSKTSDFTQITTGNKPSSALGVDDPFFLITPDLKPINGHVEAFGTTMISTEKGQIFNLTGSSAKDFAFNPFYPNSAATGEESLVEIGNDIIYGRQGRIESVTDTNRFGNSQSSDITSGIADIIQNYTGWTGVFNSRLRHVYMFPTDVSEVWVMDTAIRDSQQFSPWMRWETDHTLGFKPTFVMSMLDPLDGLEYVFMGDSSGNIYRLEGTGENGDGGINEIRTQYLTKLFSARLDARGYDYELYVKYVKDQAATIGLTFRYQGIEIFDKAVSIDIPEVAASAYYGGDFYYGGDIYYGTASGRLARQTTYPPGQANDFQILVSVTGATSFAINEIGIRLRESS